MDSNSMKVILSEARMFLEDDKATKQIQKSISKFASLLTCPLCNKVFDRPATLMACGHTFCLNCIDTYSSKYCDCPAEGCGMPISIVGSNGGSFRKLNLQMSQTIESLQLICNSLQQSEKNWWLSPATLQSIEEMKSLKMKDRQQVSSEVRKSRDEVDSPLDGRLTRNEDLEDDDDDEMIDLQANEEEECSITYDNKYGEGTDGNISEDESM